MFPAGIMHRINLSVPSGVAFHQDIPGPSMCLLIYIPIPVAQFFSNEPLANGFRVYISLDTNYSA